MLGILKYFVRIPRFVKFTIVGVVLLMGLYLLGLLPPAITSVIDTIINAIGGTLIP